MSVPPSSSDPTAIANAWFLDHQAELKSRAHANFASLGREQREEAVAEVMAMGFAWTQSAARRGRLNKLTPFYLVIYASLQWRTGRRFAGYSSKCVMSDAARVKHGVKVRSLHDDGDDGADLSRTPLSESLADHDAEDPFDVVRRMTDYPEILERESVSRKAHRTFHFIAENHGSGKQTELATELKVSAPRVTQLKRELAEALSKYQYAAPLGARSDG